MSDKKKDTKTIIAQLFGIVNKYEKKTITALDMTTKEGEKIVFENVADGELPKAGDTATINGEPVKDMVVTIVDNDGEFTITFDAEGKVVQEQSAEQMQIEALQTENADLKASITAMATEFKATLSALQGNDDEDTPAKNDAGKTTITATLDERLDKLKEKKAKRNSTIQ